MPNPDADRNDTYVITIRDFTAPFRIGVHGHERGRCQRLVIGVRLTVERPARFTDDLGTVMSYEGVLDALERLSEGPHVQLLESLADRIGDACLGDPRVVGAEVTIGKPGVHPRIEVASVTVTYHRRT